MVMVIERLLLGEHHRLRRQTFATMAERLPWNVSATPPALLHHLELSLDVLDLHFYADYGLQHLFIVLRRPGRIVCAFIFCGQGFDDLFYRLRPLELMSNPVHVGHHIVPRRHAGTQIPRW